MNLWGFWRKIVVEKKKGGFTERESDSDRSQVADEASI